MDRIFRAVAAATATAICIAAPAAAAPTTIAVGDMVASDWSQTVLRDIGNGSVAFAIVQPTAGNTAWRTVFDMAAVSTFNNTEDIVANLLLTPLYDPSGGAIDRFDFTLAARGFASGFGSGSVFGFVRPVVEQGGTVYSVRGSALPVNSSVFTALSWQFEDSADWTTVSGVGSPDFSALGAPIHFGYRWELATRCNGANGCGAASATTFVDNFAVTVLPQAVAAVVPEPAPLSLVLASAIALAAISRRRRTP